MNMVNTTYKLTEDMINKLQSLKGETKLKFYKTISFYYDNVNIRMNEDHFSINAQGISKIYQRVTLLVNFLQTKAQNENMNNKYFDFYYTVNKKRDEKKL